MMTDQPVKPTTWHDIFPGPEKPQVEEKSTSARMVEQMDGEMHRALSPKNAKRMAWASKIINGEQPVIQESGTQE